MPRVFVSLRRLSSSVALGLGLALLTVPIDTARAQGPKPQDIASAKASFQAGLALEAAGDFAQALIRFRDVTAVKATPQALFHVGRCLERLGKWTEAIGNYRLAIEQAEETRAAEAGSEADAARKALEPRLPRMVIRRGRGAQAALVSLDGVPLGGAAIGQELPVDPGPHTVVASVPGQRPVSFVVDAVEGEVRPVAIDLEPPPAAHASAPEPRNAFVWTRRHTGYVIGGVGLASLAVSAAFYALRSSTLATIEDQCMGDHCPSALEDTWDRGSKYSTLGNAFLAVGLVGVAAGGGLVLWGDRARGHSASRAVLVPAFSNGLGAGVGGSF